MQPWGLFGYAVAHLSLLSRVIRPDFSLKTYMEQAGFLNHGDVGGLA